MQARALETLIRIHEVQSFSRAAGLQNMTLSALSMQMKALEAELGVNLFDRSFRPPRMTPLGRQVVAQARTLVREHKSILELCGADDPLRGTFQMGFVQSSAVRLLPGFIELARKKAPNADFLFVSGLSETLSEQVALGRLDCAVVTRAGEVQQNLRYELIASEKMGFAAPAAYDGLGPAELANLLPFIHFMPSTGIGKLIASTFGLSTGLSQHKVLVLDSIETCMECVKTGLGYTILPEPDIRRYLDDRAVAGKFDGTEILRDLVLVSHEDAGTDRWSALLRQLLVEAYGEPVN